MIKSTGLLAAVLVLVGTSGASAQQTQPTAEAHITLTEEKGSAILTVDGTCPNLPDGTKLHIRLVVDKASVEGAFFMTAVTGERFAARKVFAKRKFAPLPYLVSIELILADQRQSIARLIRQTWALPSGARVLMVKKPIQVGTPEEEAAHRVQTIHELLTLSSKAIECCDRVDAVLKTAAPKDRKDQKAQMIDLSGFLRPQLIAPFDILRGRFVVLQEQGKISRLLDIGTSFGPLLRMHHKGKTKRAKGRLDAMRSELVRMQDELKSRLPTKQEAKEPKQSGSK